MGSGQLKDHIALVTGAGRGIGAATARAFAEAGARVAIVSRTASELEKVARAIDEKHGQGTAWFEAADISDESTVQKLFARIRKERGPVDFLVNNAATFVRAEIETHSVKDWDQVFAVNVRGAFLCSKEAFKHFKESGRGGAIVNLSSLAGVRGTEKFPGLSSYVASKFAIVGLTEALAVEGKSHRIRANCIAPGAVDTEMLRQAVPHLKTQTQPEDIARTILHLCDAKQSAHLNGALIEVYSNL